MDQPDQPVPLTPAQIENWRNVLFNIIGPYALIAPDEDIQRMRDQMQANINADRKA